MVADRVEREILIQAPVEVVWRVVTEPEQISRWWSDTADIDLRPGGEGTLTWDARATSQAATVRIVVQRLEPPHLFSFRWLHPAGAQAREGNSALVEFTLAAEGEGTRLRVVESGLLALDWPEQERARYAEEHGSGWDVHLASLRDHVARVSRASAPS
jgi:uncharacterized protein YndB with AHSA1/START domain